MCSLTDFFSISYYETLINTDVAVDTVTVVLLRNYEHQKICSNKIFPLLD